MKKYVKPELFYENFELTQQVATCDYDHLDNATDPSNCGFTGDWTDINGNQMTITIFNNSKCSFYAEEYCYHNGTGAKFSIFNS